MYGPHEPPGSIGRKQLLGSPHRRGYVQPVRISGPSTVKIAAAFSGTFGESTRQNLTVGLGVGEVYRFEVADTAGDYLVYPTVEVIDRLYPPRGSELRFPIPIELTAEELRLAAAGSFVTRVIYLEDPETALPYREDPSGQQNYFEVDPDQDPVQVAFDIGRPVAILRMGSRAPAADGDLTDFAFGSPPVVMYSDETPTPATPEVAPAAYPLIRKSPTPPRPLRIPAHVAPVLEKRP